MTTLDNRRRPPMPQVSRVIVLKNYQLLLTFTTGEVKLYDASWVLSHPMTTELKDLAFFNKAHVSHGTVVWSKQLDLGPDDLYENSVAVKDEKGEELIAV